MFKQKKIVTHPHISPERCFGRLKIMEKLDQLELEFRNERKRKQEKEKKIKTITINISFHFHLRDF